MGYLPFLLSMVKLVAVIAVFVSVAFYTLLERKLLGYAQIRKGAGKPSVAGILVPFADAVKLLFKQSTSVSASSTLYWIRGGSGSKYRVVGGLRAVAQTVSYEIVFSFMFLVYAIILGFSLVRSPSILWFGVGVAVFILC